MFQAKDVARCPRVRKDGFSRMFRAIGGEIAKEGVARSQRQKSEDRFARCFGFWEKAVDDLVGSPVAPNGYELALSPSIRPPRNACCVSGP